METLVALEQGINRSVLARQVDDVVGEVQRDFIQRKIQVLDLLGENDVAVAIVARQRSASVGMHGEFPHLKFLVGDSLTHVQSDSRSGPVKMCEELIVAQSLPLRRASAPSDSSRG
jgi:hypothetical protein